MNLKNACFIALFITLASILLTVSGYTIFYATLLTEHFHSAHLINAVVAILSLLLEAVGFIVFLLAMLNRLRNPDTNPKPLFVLAGILILLGALIAIAMNMMHSVGLYRHLPIIRFMLYMGLYLFAFLASLCLGIFAFTQSSGKSLAALALAFFVVLFSLIIINNAMHFQQYFQGNLIRDVGSMLMLLGNITNHIAPIFFLSVFLQHRPWPPMATVADPAPEPLPTLSAEADLPEQE